jgi:ketosteroid isomerase-like protein
MLGLANVSNDGATGTGSDGGHDAADVAAIELVTADLLNAVNESNLAGVLAVWSYGGVLMPPHHPSVRGRQEIERYFRRLFSVRRFRFTFTSSHIEVCGDVAFERVEYEVVVSGTAAGPEVRDVGKGLHVYRRRGGEWELEMDIWNSDNPAVAGE